MVHWNQKTISHFKRNIWNYLGIALGMLGLASSVYFYLLSEKKYEPILTVDSERIEIVKPGNYEGKTFKVVKANGKSINAGLYAVKVLFWNSGNRALKPENILEPIKILMEDSGEILEVSKVSQSRDISGIKLFLDSIGRKEILIELKILEPIDACVFQIIYEGTKQSKFTVKGLFEETGAVKSEPPVSFTLILWKTIKIGSVIFVVATVFGFASWSSRRMERLPKGNRLKTAYDWIIIIFGLVLAAAVIVILPYSLITSAIDSSECLRQNVG